MTANKHARRLRRKHKALKDTTRGGNEVYDNDRSEEKKVFTDAHAHDTTDAITDYDNS